MHLVLFSTFLWLIAILQRSHCNYATKTNYRQKHKLCALSKELVKDAMAKRAAINYMKPYYDSDSIFHMAQMIYDIKKKYVRQVFVYMKMLESFEKVKLDELLMFLVEVQQLAMDIDNLVQMMEEWEDRNTRKKRISRTGQTLRERQLQEREQIEGQMRMKQKQQNYVERKKMLWSLAHGQSRSGLGTDSFKKRNVAVEGFDFDAVG